MFVKICGITNEEDALLSVAMGADALGFVFAPSPRQVVPAKVADIVRRLPAHVMTIGVFRNHDPRRVADIVREAGLRGAQLHGNESRADVDLVTQEVGWVMKALPGGEGDPTAYRTNLIMYDAVRPGSGIAWDWSSVLPLPMDIRIVLAGGLSPDNVADAILTVRPWGVDVSSGVESEPGRKDAVKVRRFIRHARDAAAAYEDGE